MARKSREGTPRPLSPQARARRMEYEGGAPVRQAGGFLVQTGIEPQVLATLKKDLNLGEGYMPIIGSIWRTYVAPGKHKRIVTVEEDGKKVQREEEYEQKEEALPAEGTAEYEALAEFMFHPDVLGQIIVLQNRNLKGSTFAYSREHVMNAVQKEIGLDEKGSLKRKDVNILLKHLRQTYEMKKDSQIVQDLGLTKADLKEITEDPAKRKEFVTEISSAIKSKPKDLLASARALDAFTFLSSPLSLPYIKDSLKAIANHFKEGVKSGAIKLDTRASEVGEGLFALFTIGDGKLNDNQRVMLRNVLWGMQSYGICTVPVKRERTTGRIDISPIQFNPGSHALLAKYLNDFLTGDGSQDTGKGSKIVDEQHIRAIVQQKKQAGEFAPPDADTSSQELSKGAQRAIDRFIANAENPLYNAITRLKQGGRLTIAKLRWHKQGEAAERFDKVTKQKDLLGKFDDLGGDSLLDGSFKDLLTQLNVNKQREDRVFRRLGAYRSHASSLADKSQEGIFNIKEETERIQRFLGKQQTLAIEAKAEYDALKNFVDKTKAILRDIQVTSAALPGQVAVEKELGPVFGVFVRAYKELLGKSKSIEATIKKAEDAIKRLEEQHRDILIKTKEKPTLPGDFRNNPVVSTFQDVERKLLRIQFPADMSEADRKPRLNLFLDVRKRLFSRIAQANLSKEDVTEEDVKDIEIIFQDQIAKRILEADKAVFGKDGVSRAKWQLLRAELFDILQKDVLDIIIPKEE